jgi:hypothetical protein
VEVWTRKGLQRFLVLFFIELSTRRVQIAGISARANGLWMSQIARNLTDTEDGLLQGKGYPKGFLVCNRKHSTPGSRHGHRLRKGIAFPSIPVTHPFPGDGASRIGTSSKENIPKMKRPLLPLFFIPVLAAAVFAALDKDGDLLLSNYQHLRTITIPAGLAYFGSGVSVDVVDTDTTLPLTPITVGKILVAPAVSQTTHSVAADAVNNHIFVPVTGVGVQVWTAVPSASSSAQVPSSATMRLSFRR